MRLFNMCSFIPVLVPMIFASACYAQFVDGPVQHDGNTYYLLDQSTWNEAEGEANALGGHLATVEDAEQNDWIFSTFATYGGVQRELAIGLYDATASGTFGWSSGDPVAYTNWAPGEPNYLGQELYTYILPPEVSTNAYWNNDYDRSTASYNGLGGIYGPFPVYGVAEVVPEPSCALVLLMGGPLLLQSRLRLRRPFLRHRPSVLFHK